MGFDIFQLWRKGNSNLISVPPVNQLLQKLNIYLHITYYAASIAEKLRFLGSMSLVLTFYCVLEELSKVFN